MKLHELKASDLKDLRGCETAEDIVARKDLAQFSIDITHRGYEYEVGRNCVTYLGDYWVFEVSTGIIYRGSLGDIKAYIKVCSDAADEADSNS